MALGGTVEGMGYQKIPGRERTRGGGAAMVMNKSMMPPLEGVSFPIRLWGLGFEGKPCFTKDIVDDSFVPKGENRKPVPQPASKPAPKPAPKRQACPTTAYLWATMHRHASAWPCLCTGPTCAPHPVFCKRCSVHIPIRVVPRAQTPAIRHGVWHSVLSSSPK